MPGQEKAPGFRVEAGRVFARAGEGSWRAGGGAGGRAGEAGGCCCACSPAWVSGCSCCSSVATGAVLAVCVHQHQPGSQGRAGWVSTLPSSYCGTLKPLLRLLGASCVQGADTIPARAGECAVEHLLGRCSWVMCPSVSLGSFQCCQALEHRLGADPGSCPL